MVWIIGFFGTFLSIYGFFRSYGLLDAFCHYMCWCWRHMEEGVKHLKGCMG